MNDIEKAIRKQLENIENRTGKTLAQLATIIKKTGLTKHGEIRDMLKRELGMGHGDANMLVHHVLKSAGPAATAGQSLDDVVAGFYAGPKAALRPIHDALMEEIDRFGEFEIAPKKNYVSLRRKKQFAMIGPATNTRVEVGINLKDIESTDRLLQNPPNSMCNFKVKLATKEEVDTELIAWIRLAYDAAG